MNHIKVTFDTGKIRWHFKLVITNVDGGWIWCFMVILVQFNNDVLKPFQAPFLSFEWWPRLQLVIQFVIYCSRCITYFSISGNKIEHLSDNAKQKKQNHPTLRVLSILYLYAIWLHINPCFWQLTRQRDPGAKCYWPEPWVSKEKSNWKRFCVQRIRKREHGCHWRWWASMATNWMQQEKRGAVLPANAFCRS